MTRLSQIKKIISEEKDMLIKNYKVKRIGVFGSVVRGEDTDKSDIDILVDFVDPVDFIEFLDLEEHLSKKLGKNVDLVSRKALKPYIGKEVMKEIIYLL